MNRSRLKFVSKQANPPEIIFKGRISTKLSFLELSCQIKWMIVVVETVQIMEKVNRQRIQILFHKCISCRHKLIQHSLIPKIN
jgi:hypothetical protein